MTRDPRPYGIENTTDKVRRPGAVRRRCDAVCTECIVGHSYKAQIDPAAPVASQLAGNGDLGTDGLGHE